jgi:hypothetical protein
LAADNLTLKFTIYALLVPRYSKHYLKIIEAVVIEKLKISNCIHIQPLTILAPP